MDMFFVPHRSRIGFKDATLVLETQATDIIVVLASPLLAGDEQMSLSFFLYPFNVFLTGKTKTCEGGDTYLDKFPRVCIGGNRDNFVSLRFHFTPSQ